MCNYFDEHFEVSCLECNNRSGSFCEIHNTEIEVSSDGCEEFEEIEYFDQ